MAEDITQTMAPAEPAQTANPAPTEPVKQVQPTEPVATEPAKEPDTAQKKYDLGSNKNLNDGSDVEKKPSEPKLVDDKTEFKLPEGATLDAEKSKMFKEVCKELKLSEEQAQKIVDMDSKYQQEVANKLFQKQIDDWKKETLSMLGDKAEEKLAEAHNAYQKFGTEKFVKLMKATGLDNHPAVVEVFRNINSKIATDTLVPGTSNGVKSSMTFEEALYGKEK